MKRIGRIFTDFFEDPALSAKSGKSAFYSSARFFT